MPALQPAAEIVRTDRINLALLRSMPLLSAVFPGEKTSYYDQCGGDWLDDWPVVAHYFAN